jgi:hypothetical protein
MKKIYVRELNVPIDAMLEVAPLLHENEITNEITGSNEDDEIITIEVHYDKEEKETIHKIIGIIDTYDEGANDDEDDK